MKLTFSPKTVGIISLLVVAASPSLQPPASAQTQNACSIASAKAPESSYDGVNLSPTQQSAFNAFSKPRDALSNRLSQKAKRVVKPNASVMFFPKQGAKIPSDLQKIIAVERVVKPAQIPSLTAKYGKYGKFIPETTLVYSQALFEEYEREMKLLDDRSLEVMSPAQRQRYQQNQATFKKINQICGTQDGPFVKVGNSYEMGGSFFD
jgi:hypothetical protein